MAAGSFSVGDWAASVRDGATAATAAEDRRKRRRVGISGVIVTVLLYAVGINLGINLQAGDLLSAL